MFSISICHCLQNGVCTCYFKLCQLESKRIRSRRGNCLHFSLPLIITSTLPHCICIVRFSLLFLQSMGFAHWRHDPFQNQVRSTRWLRGYGKWMCWTWNSEIFFSCAFTLHQFNALSRAYTLLFLYIVGYPTPIQTSNARTGHVRLASTLSVDLFFLLFYFNFLHFWLVLLFLVRKSDNWNIFPPPMIHDWGWM